MNIRLLTSEDFPDLKLVLDGTELFPSDMLPALANGFISSDKSEDIWLTCEADGKAIGFCYARPEPLTDRTWNMLAIAVLPERQGGGAGAAIVRALETVLRNNNHRILIADTSGTEKFTRTRAFYATNGYSEEARIRDFWGDGDDKVVFWKSLT